MADFSFFKKKEEPKEAAKPQKIVAAHPDDKDFFEKVFAEKRIKFTFEVASDGYYEYSIDADRLPEVEPILFPPEDETEEISPPAEPVPEKKTALTDQIFGAQKKAGGQSESKNLPPKTTPSSSFGGQNPTYKQPPYTPPSTPKTQSQGFPQNDFVRNVQAAERGELPPRKPQTSPLTPAQNAPKISPQPSQKTSPASPKPAPKDLTKDFGILTLEEQKRLDERQAKSEAEKKPKKKRVKTGRDNQVKTRLTDTEMQLFSERVKASGMKQGEFMRECLLHETVNVRSLTDIDAQAFGKLMEMASDLGRIGGLIKGTVMVNKDEFAVLSPTEKESLEQQIRELNQLKDQLLKVVQNLYGDT